MLDFNHRPTLSEKLTELIDQALIHEQAQRQPRSYLGASRIGVECSLQLQYEVTHTPKDENFSGRILRIFEAGHVFEDLAIRWLRQAGFELYTEKTNGEPFGFSIVGGRIKGHVDGIIAAAPEILGLRPPMLWECKSLNAKSWKDLANHKLKKSKPVYAVQIALYQAYMEPSIPGIASNPALFTAINKDTAELYFELVPFDAALAQEASDRGLNIVKATEAGEWLPRISPSHSHINCKVCPWQNTCRKEI